MSVRMITQVKHSFDLSYKTLVYCSYKRNNVNIIFKHAIESAPFELTRIIIKVLFGENFLIRSDSYGWIFFTSQRGISIYIHVSD